ncbi:MAG: TMEM175 family protein [Methylocystis sp.]|uniref:TMEM175 family protein n=1 Tax=Methylocystis sp. TaxID=1911079 RepID=UPI003DA3F9B4
METNRLEAFSDGVLAIVITIMVLELKVPAGEDVTALLPLWPVFVSYVLSFIYIGIYWNNHHHLIKAARRVNGAALWANLHLLFWLSLLPFTTGWMGENHFARAPICLYGANLLAAALAYTLLQAVLIRLHGPESLLARAIGRDFKGRISPVLYALGIAAAWLLSPLLGLAFFIGVALIWLVPDQRIEKTVASMKDRP